MKSETNDVKLCKTCPHGLCLMRIKKEGLATRTATVPTTLLKWCSSSISSVSRAVDQHVSLCASLTITYNKRRDFSSKLDCHPNEDYNNTGELWIIHILNNSTVYVSVIIRKIRHDRESSKARHSTNDALDIRWINAMLDQSCQKPDAWLRIFLRSIELICYAAFFTSDIAIKSLEEITGWYLN